MTTTIGEAFTAVFTGHPMLWVLLWTFATGACSGALIILKLNRRLDDDLTQSRMRYTEAVDKYTHALAKERDLWRQQYLDSQGVPTLKPGLKADAQVIIKGGPL